MRRKLSPWCKQVRIAMIERDMSVKMLATEAQLSKEYTSAVINGRVYSESAAKAIGEVLEIPVTEYSSLLE